MNKKLLVALFMGVLICSLAVIPLMAQGQDEPTEEPTIEPTYEPPVNNPTDTTTATPTATHTSTPSSSAQPSSSSSPTSSSSSSHKPTGTHKTTPHPSKNGGIDYLLVGGITAVVVAIIGVLLVAVKRRGVSERSLRRYNSQQFQNWVIKKLDGKPATARDISMGIAGFTHRGYPVFVSQSDSLTMMDIDRFASALARNRTPNGVIVAYGYGADAIRGKVRARMNYRIDIEMLTVSELMYSNRGY